MTADTPARAGKVREWRERVRAAWQRLRGGKLTPARAAASVAVGLAIGVTPLWGVHFFLVLAVCMPLRLDVPVAYLAANISLPFIAPFLTFAEVEIGARVLNGEFLPITSREAMAAHGMGRFVKEIAVGTLFFAPMMAAIGGALTYLVARLGERGIAEEDRSFEGLIERVAERYAAGRTATRMYVRSKMAHDPVVRAVLDLGDLGEVCDIGCGRGQLAIALLEAKRATQVTGFDWDAKKIEEARRASSGLAATFTVRDIREAEEPCDTVLLVDVLHYFASEEQDAMLERAATMARSAIVVRDLDPDRGFRSWLTRVQETITTGVRFNRGQRLNIRPISAMTRILEAEGFDVEITPCWQGTPFANVLVVAHRLERQANLPERA